MNNNNEVIGTGQVEVNQMMELVLAGKTVEQIGAEFGMSRRTFLRKKKANPAISAAYDAAFLQLRGADRIKRDGTKWIAVEGADRAVGGSVDIDPRPSRIRVLQYIASSPHASFKAIRLGTNLHEDKVSAALAILILDEGSVRAHRDGKGNFRYYLSKVGRDLVGGMALANETQDQGFNRGSSERYSSHDSGLGRGDLGLQT